jgi:ribosome-associated protein
MVKSQATDRTIRRQLRRALEAAVSKKASESVLLDVRALAGFTDYFLICHGSNPRQIQTIAEEVDRSLSTTGLNPLHTEGMEHAEWVVLDYGSFVVHIFSEKARRFYDLERIWQKAPRVPTRRKQ